MVGRYQPYLYDAQLDHSNFNPKAVTMASRLPPPPPRKKQEGPLIEFNKHPDSYLILPYGNTNVKPMHKKTKIFVKVARWIQLAFRVCTLLGAVGVLLCGIFIRGATDTEGYIMRIPVRYNEVLRIHLANARSPASTSSSVSMASTISSVMRNRGRRVAPPAITSSRSSWMSVLYHSTSSPC
jgi:hypothetical protein